ncbi:hypothetical protein NT239_15365 [Chitinibacter sp. SCUT-21]|uniref:hypothetical protein n=1 Tax=Chitinibacter sp. SCUT-21 TaxID=2970891 RepID=UPI0035A6CC8A
MNEVLIQRALPALGGNVLPPFHDVRSARDWLKLLPMINVPVAHSELSQAISQLNQSDLPALDNLKIVEQFRESVHILQDAMIMKLMTKPLPLSDEEQRVWNEVDNLWYLLERCYARVWHAASQDEIGVTEFLPLLAERTLYYACKRICNTAHIYRRPDDKQWRELFAYYELAKAQHLDKLKARDSLIQISGITTPESVFIHALLFCAANPNQYTFKQQTWLSQRLEIFATRCTLAQSAQTLPNRPALFIDLLSPAAPKRRQQARQESELEIETYTLAQVISKRIKLLKLGELPDKIGLGSELSSQAADELLREVYRAWCEHPIERSLPRRNNSNYVEVGISLSNLHLILAKDHFAPPPQNEQQMSSNELMQIRMFGQTSARMVVQPIKTETQQWQIQNETAQGICIQRERDHEQRVHLHQLVLLADGKSHLIGQIRWLSETAQMRELGIALLPGIPEAASIRAQDAARFGQGDFTKAVLLSAIPALKTPASLILPPGWFRQGRLLEYWDGKQMHRIRLVSLLSRGIDFERIHFVPSGGL